MSPSGQADRNSRTPRALVHDLDLKIIRVDSETKWHQLTLIAANQEWWWPGTGKIEIFLLSFCPVQISYHFGLNFSVQVENVRDGWTLNENKQLFLIFSIV
jgi:hypothetical protein